MASRFAPECLPIVDLGNVPTFVIDGMESLVFHAGWARSRYFIIEPSPDSVGAGDLSHFRPLCRRINLAIHCPLNVSREILADAGNALIPRGIRLAS